MLQSTFEAHILFETGCTHSSAGLVVGCPSRSRWLGVMAMLWSGLASAVNWLAKHCSPANAVTYGVRWDGRTNSTRCLGDEGELLNATVRIEICGRSEPRTHGVRRKGSCQALSLPPRWIVGILLRVGEGIIMGHTTTPAAVANPPREHLRGFVAIGIHAAC